MEEISAVMILASLLPMSPSVDPFGTEGCDGDDGARQGQLPACCQDLFTQASVERFT